MPNPRHPRVVVVGRRLTAEQADRRQGLVTAARALASAGGYDAVTISTLCERAGVARATFYPYFGSKDHVLAEAVVQWGHERMDELRRHPPAGRTPFERVVGTLRWVLDAVEREPNLIRAHVQSMVSSDFGVGETQRQLAALVTGYLEAGLGPAVDFDVSAVSMILSHVFFGTLVNMSAGRVSAEAVMEELTTTARYLLEPRGDRISSATDEGVGESTPPKAQARRGRRVQTPSRRRSQ